MKEAIIFDSNYNVSDADLDEFLSVAQKVVNNDYITFMPVTPGGPHTPILTIMKGRRYARIVALGYKHGYGSPRTVWGFIDMTNGDLLKANSWKAPAKNFARGNIFDTDRGLLGQKWTGVA